MAPGYLAWVVDDGEHVHIGTAGHARRLRQGVRTTMREFMAAAPGLPAVPPGAEVERRGGPIPVGGLLRRIASPAGLLVGDAAGAVSPLTAGALDQGRSPALVEAGFAALRTRPGRAAARRILFGDRSFPEA